MSRKMNTIEVDAATAKTLKVRAAQFGVSVAKFVADLVANDELPKKLEVMRSTGRGPWTPSVLAQDARRYAEYKRTGMAVPGEDVEAWINSLGTKNKLPKPKPRKMGRIVTSRKPQRRHDRA